jgi:butyrate kinase
MKQKVMVSLRQIKCKLLEIIPRNLHYHNNKIKQIFYCHNHKAIAALGHKDLISALWDLRVDVVGIGGGVSVGTYD